MTPNPAPPGAPRFHSRYIALPLLTLTTRMVNPEDATHEATSLVLLHRLDGDQANAETAVAGWIDQLFALVGRGQVRPEQRDFAWVVG